MLHCAVTWLKVSWIRWRSEWICKGILTIFFLVTIWGSSNNIAADMIHGKSIVIPKISLYSPSDPCVLSNLIGSLSQNNETLFIPQALNNAWSKQSKMALLTCISRCQLNQLKVVFFWSIEFKFCWDNFEFVCIH